MSIVKCQKCNEEYDTMYSFYACKKLSKRNQSEQDGIIKNIVNQFSETFFGGLFAFVIPLILMALLAYFFYQIEDKLLTILISSAIISFIGIIFGIYFSSEKKQKSKSKTVSNIALFFDAIMGIWVIVCISSIIILLIYFFF